MRNATHRSSSLMGLSGAVACRTSFSTRPFASFSSLARTILVGLLFLPSSSSSSAPGASATTGSA